tara:strand:- start:4791 stop:6656 length:1866 start_codon:yes stop_codon:yes gene_type:complete
MCGIVGVCSGRPIENRYWLHSAIKSLSHRGPNATGELWSRDFCVGFGHSRLSIIDLSERGNQPFINKRHQISLIFNGEIYNHKDLRKILIDRGHSFTSNSDTEVLILSYIEWGINCLSKLNGAFSFALHDQKKAIVLLSRDRSGEKPLYFYKDHLSLYFASELKALFKNKALPRQIDITGLNSYLIHGFSAGERSLVKGYRKLLPGHNLIFDLNKGDFNIKRYWDLPQEQYSSDLSKEDLIGFLEELLEDSVKKQLISDVPSGILLSGGIDSSLITAMASRNFEKINTYNISFSGYSKFDESYKARTIANYFGTNHIELNAEPSCIENLYYLSEIFDEPIIDSSIIPTYLIYKLVSNHSTVVLGGDGGDELFGGYDHYYKFLIMEEISNLLPSRMKSILGKYSNKFLPSDLSISMYLSNMTTDFNTSLPNIPCYFNQEYRINLFGQYLNHNIDKSSYLTKPLINPKNTVQRLTRQDFYNYLASDILVKIDRTSMANSIEARAPFLDYRIIDFAYKSIPASYKVSSKQTKIILRKMASRLLPSGIHKQQKNGFNIPLRDWLSQGPFRDFFFDVLYSHDSIINKSITDSLFKNLSKGSLNPERLYGLVQLELWRKTHNIEFNS